MGTTVLIVDDSVTMRGIVANALVEAGWAVVTAANGREALAVFERQPVAMVITDWNMPEMNGLELVSALRARAGPAQLPILVLTTEVDDASRQTARAAGATGWLNKPLDEATLIQVTISLLGAGQVGS